MILQFLPLALSLGPPLTHKCKFFLVHPNPTLAISTLPELLSGRRRTYEFTVLGSIRKFIINLHCQTALLTHPLIFQHLKYLYPNIYIYTQMNLPNNSVDFFSKLLFQSYTKTNLPFERTSLNKKEEILGTGCIGNIFYVVLVC